MSDIAVIHSEERIVIAARLVEIAGDRIDRQRVVISVKWCAVGNGVGARSARDSYPSTPSCTLLQV